MKNIRPQQQVKLSFCFVCKLHLFLLAFVSLFLFYSLTYATELKQEKRVLILFSNQSDLPAYPIVEKGIKSSLKAGTEFHIEYFIEYMDYYRNPDPTYIQSLLDSYHRKFSNHKLDLVIPYSAPALSLVIAHDNDLFQQTPVVFSGILREQLKGQNLSPMVTGVVTDIDYAGLLETALRIHPQTRHVAVVNGASVTGLLYEKEFRKALDPYTKRFDFIYLTRLPMGEIVDKVHNLPEHSVVLYYLLARDGGGKSFIPREVSSILSEVANAPVYGCLDSYFGHGIVGGRMTSMEMTGVKAGEMALRILRGEKPSDFSITSQGTIIDLFDWRQFKRFNIRENRLPPGSTVRFKTYSFWELYRWYIVAALFLILTQGGLISFLLRQRAQRHRAQLQLAERLRFEEMLSALSARFVNLPPDRVDGEIKRVLESIGKGLNVDRVSVFEISEEDQRLHLVHSHKDVEIAAPPSEFKFKQLPWIRQKLFNGEIISFTDPEDLPAEAGADRNFLSDRGILSLVVIPLSTGEKTVGLLSLAMLRQHKKWPHGLIRQCRLIAEVFSNALVRKRHEESMVQAEAKYRMVADFTYDWEYWANVDGSLEYVSPSCERISGYTPRDFIDNPPLLKEIIVPEDRDIWDRHYRDSRQVLKPCEIQFRIQRRDGQTRWIEHDCQPVTDHQGRLQGIRASNRDISGRKKAELEVQQQRNELAHVTRVAALGELTGSIAHEINQPLAAIRNYANAAQRFLSQSEPDLNKAKDALEGIVRDDRRAAEVISGVRELLKKEEPHYQPVQMNQVIQETLAFIRSDALLEGFTIETDLAPALPVVPGDRVQLQQVLLNLILNSVDAMNTVKPDLRKLVIKTENKEDRDVKVSVRDFGAGIDEARRVKLFESFFTTKPRGMGMGLTISQRIIHDHGGSIRAENNPGGGATFWFTLPAGNEENGVPGVEGRGKIRS